MKRNIGIFLGSGPGTIKSHEGIIKLLLSLLRSDEFRKRVVIALPSWGRKELINLLREEGIEAGDLEFLIWRKRKSAFFVLHEILLKILKKKRNRKKSNRRILKYIEEKIIDLSARSILLFFLLMLPLSIVYLIRATSPLIEKLKQPLISKVWLKIKPWASQESRKIRDYVHKIYRSIRTYEFTKLVQRINRRPDIETWYIPTGFWPEIKNIKATKIIAIPDIVFEEFPFAFAPHSKSFENGNSQIQETMKIKAHFLCYSNHVKIQHLSKPFHIDEKNISVLRHGCTDLSPYLQRENQTPRESAIQIIQSFQKDVLKDNPYLTDFYLPSMRYIFYSSQVRPHKNILNLVKAYELLLRHRFLNLKLIITGNLSGDSNLKTYITDRHLQNDVISLYGVSTEVLAALNHLAICSVNPTLFEGGFPFTFTEAYSVGTPSVMSRIAVVLEESQDETLNSLMLFDPYRVESMADRIEWAVHHRSELIQLQKTLYEKLASQSWTQCANEYLSLFDRVGKPQM